MSRSAWVLVLLFGLVWGVSGQGGYGGEDDGSYARDDGYGGSDDGGYGGSDDGGYGGDDGGYGSDDDSYGSDDVGFGGDRLGGMRDGLRDRLGGMRDGLSDRLGGMRDGLSDRLGGKRDGLSDRLGGMRDSLSDRLGGMGDGTGDYDWGAHLDRLRDHMGDGMGDSMGDSMGGEITNRLQTLSRGLQSVFAMISAAKRTGDGGMARRHPSRFSETWRTKCRPGVIYAPYACDADPCEGAVCSGPDPEEVHCVPDYCNARCMPVFYNKTGKGERVKCSGEQAGECPAVPYGFKGHCAHSCNVDDDCKAGHKCCSNGCGTQCIWAKFETDEDVSKCKLKLGDPAEDGSRDLWLFRPDEKGGTLYSTDARGNGTSFAKFSGTRQEMAAEIRDGAAAAGAEVTVQDRSGGQPVHWKVEDEKIYRGMMTADGAETDWRVVAVCNCKNCQMKGRQDSGGRGQDRDEGDAAGGEMDRDEEGEAGGGMGRERPAGDQDGSDGPKDQVRRPGGRGEGDQGDRTEGGGGSPPR